MLLLARKIYQTNSLDENREVGIVISDKEVINKIAEQFVADFGS